MPALKNLLHERFCVLFAELKLHDMSNGQIYIKAGGTAKNPHVADVNASKLLKRQDVLNRIAEIGEPAVRQANAHSIELKDKVEMVFYRALADGDYAAANRANELYGKITGELIERSENRTTLAFDELNSADEVFAAIDPKHVKAFAKALNIQLDAAGKVINHEPDRHEAWLARVRGPQRQLTQLSDDDDGPNSITGA